jgi:hypothetical protein
VTFNNNTLAGAGTESPAALEREPGNWRIALVDMSQAPTRHNGLDCLPWQYVILVRAGARARMVEDGADPEDLLAELFETIPRRWLLDHIVEARMLPCRCECQILRLPYPRPIRRRGAA